MSQSPSQKPAAPKAAHVPSTLPTTALPELITQVPGPESVALARRLERVESRNATALKPIPIFWERAEGANLWDVDGNRYIDLTAAFGVANVGHAHPEVVAAVTQQAETLLHGMGDVHPPRVKVELLERLTALYPRDLRLGTSAPPTPARALLSSSGSDAVETAIKSAMLATGRSGLLAFEGAYHGLSFGALDATWREDFRAPFRARLPNRTRFSPYGDIDAVRQIAEEDRVNGEIGAILVEPVQGRGGERVPPPGFLSALRSLCDEEGWLLIADEIYTGFGRTGRVFACEHEGVVPDLLCVGKGLASGMPISACLGTEAVFDAWPTSQGEALHTQTFLGHPASCAAALASLEVSQRDALADRSQRLGERTLDTLSRNLGQCAVVREVRGLGLMIGIECQNGEIALAMTQRLLERGFIVLPSGEGGRVISLTPPLMIGEAALEAALDVLTEELKTAADQIRGSL